MGRYANTINAYAQDEINVRVFKRSRRLQSWGQAAYMLNVTTNKFRNDIDKKVQKLLTKAEAQHVKKLAA